MKFRFKQTKEGGSMHQCISVYPNSNSSMNQLNEYLELAKRYGIEEVFTSIHLPEYSMEDQLAYLEQVSEAAKRLDMELTADIGGPFISMALDNPAILERLKKVNLDFLRLDYGYNENQLTVLYESLHIKGFVINASMVNEDELKRHLHFFKELDENIFIRACHNFYVREESGLDIDFALNQTKLFESFNIPVYFCVPCHDHPRGPLHLGLPTLEYHRYQDMDMILMDLMHTFHAQGILYSDEWMSEKQFKLIQKTLIEKVIDIPVFLNQNLTEIEKRIILKKHIFRYDSNASFLRSRSSREMAEYAAKIFPANCIERHKGDITIDNERYLRYSGELQVVCSDAKQDQRVNVSAHLRTADDLQKLSFFRFGYAYQFIDSE